MKKNELRVWAMRTHLPDQWWVEIDGVVHESPVSLDEAFRMADKTQEAYIVHVSHAEETDEPHWHRMGAEDVGEDSFGIPKWVCAKCRYSFEKRKVKSAPVSAMEIAGYLLIIPGLVMTIVRRKSAKRTCPRCGSTSLVIGKTKAGRALLGR